MKHLSNASKSQLGQLDMSRSSTFDFFATLGLLQCIRRNMLVGVALLELLILYHVISVDLQVGSLQCNTGVEVVLERTLSSILAIL